MDRHLERETAKQAIEGGREYIQSKADRTANGDSSAYSRGAFNQRNCRHPVHLREKSREV